MSEPANELAAPSGSARFLADFPHFVALHVVETPDDARKIVAGFTDDMRACCEYDHSAEGDRKAELVFLREHLNAPLIVHECVHAACNWSISEEMSKAPEDITEEEMQQHFEEVLSRVVEQLCVDAFDALLPNAERSNPADNAGGAKGKDSNDK